MHEISSGGMHPDFPECWRAAAMHLQKQVQGRLSWLKADLDSPALEHLSFRLGNQLFFVRIEDVDDRVTGPGSSAGLLTIAQGCAGVPCLLPMQRRVTGWEPARPNWGLIHAKTNAVVDPIALITDEKIEMTDWELQDFAVQIVRDVLRKEGRTIASTQSNPSVNPSIWLSGENGLEFVVVRATRHPAGLPSLPENISAIADSCSKLAKRGYYAPVCVANKDDPFAPNSEGALPLWRGHALVVRFEGLVDL